MQYVNEYSFPSNDTVKRIEKFTDINSQKVRQQERVMKVQSVDEIVQVAKSNGFHMKGFTDYSQFNEDQYQFLYIFENVVV